jgi:predicted DCC family thiol-disulfide oxidoreductase YuxK
MATPAPLHVHYDNDCGMCTRAVLWVRERTKGVVLLPLDADRAQRDELIVRIGETTYRGAGAVAVLLRHNKYYRWRLVGFVLSLRGVRPLARWAYKRVANNRDRISRRFGWEACALPDPRHVSANDD